jgi:hypothetical protein
LIGAHEIDVDRAAELADILMKRRRYGAYPRIVDKDVQPTVLRDGSIGSGLAPGRIANVHRHRECPPPALANPGCGSLELVGAARDKYHVGPRFGESPREAGA